VDHPDGNKVCCHWCRRRVPFRRHRAGHMRRQGGPLGFPGPAGGRNRRRAQQGRRHELHAKSWRRGGDGRGVGVGAGAACPPWPQV